MADNTVKPHSVLTAVQALLHTPSPEETGGGAYLMKQVSMATALLMQSPGLYSVSLSVLASAYQCYILQPDKVSGADRGLGAALGQAEEVISSLVDHAPHTWSRRVLQWCVGVASSASRQSSGRTMPSQSLEDLQRVWLQHPKLMVVIKILDKCTLHLVSSGRAEECVGVVVRECLDYAPALNWLLTHVLSQKPAALLLPFLEQVLHLSLSPLSPSFTAVGQTLEFLGHSCRSVVGECVLEVVGNVVRGKGQRQGWGRRVEFLLRLAPLCEGLLSSISQDCLQLVTAEKIKLIVTAASSGGDELQDKHMSSDEDEGEVRSDEEAAGDKGPVATSNSGGVESAVVEVLRVLGKEAAAQAITQLIQTYCCLADLAQSQEDAMEEGEIVHVSLVNVVQEGCQVILTQLLHQLHVATMAHLSLGPRGARGAGNEAEFAVGLQCGLQVWSVLMLQPLMDAKCREWVHCAVSSVCVCAAELQAAQALATMLLNCQHRQLLGHVLRVYAEVSVRYSQLAHSAVQAALSACLEGAQPHWLCENLWRITVDKKAVDVDDHTRSKFLAAVSASLLPLSTLLCALSEGRWGMEESGVLREVEGSGEWLLMEAMAGVETLERSGGDYSAHCQVLSNLLSFFFNCLTQTTCLLEQDGKVDVRAEISLGRCATLLAGWVGPRGSHGDQECLRVFFLTSLITRALSQDKGKHLGTSQVKEGKPGECRDLLPSNQMLALGASHTASGRSGSLQHIRQPQQSQLGDLHVTSTTHWTNHILSLLELVAIGNGDLVVSVLLDRVAPHLPPDSAPWLPGEGARSTSLEWSLRVKQQFDQHPLLWQLLLFSAHSGCGFSPCEPVVCSLLLVLTQHWFSCRYSNSVAVGKELHSSVRLVECLAAAGWLPVPLCYCAELFQSVTSHDLYLLLNAISDYIKANLQPLRRGALAQLKDTEYKGVLKGVLLRDIHKLGHLYVHYIT